MTSSSLDTAVCFFVMVAVDDSAAVERRKAFLLNLEVMSVLIGQLNNNFSPPMVELSPAALFHWPGRRRSSSASS